jgi:hypothetical protein
MGMALVGVAGGVSAGVLQAFRRMRYGVQMFT